MLTVNVRNLLHNDNLTDLNQAAQLSAMIYANTRRSQPVRLDFTGVLWASPSFLIKVFEKAQETLSAWDLTKLIYIEGANFSIIHTLSTFVFLYWFNWDKDSRYSTLYNNVKDLGPKTTL